MARVSTALFFVLAVLPLALPLPKSQPRILMRSSDDPASRNAITDLVDNIRTIIKEGSESLNLPVLDPFNLESIDTSFSEIGAYKVAGGLRNVISTGLGDFEATMSTRTIIPLLRLGVTVEITVPHLHANGKYFLDSLLGEVVHLYGDGNMQLDISEIKVTVDAVINPGVTSSTVRSVNTNIEVGDFQFALDGLLDGGLVDGIFNLAVNELAKIIYQGQKGALEDYLAEILEEPISEAIKDYGYYDLICLIGLCGSGGGDGDGDGAGAGDVDGGVGDDSDGVRVDVDDGILLVSGDHGEIRYIPKVAPELEKEVFHQRP